MSGQHYFKIDVFSHHFVISRIQARGTPVVESFARQYIQYGLVKQGRRFVRAPVKVFGSRVRGPLGSVFEYRFHVEQFKDFMKHLENNQILPHTYEIEQHRPHPGADETYVIRDGWVLRENQVPVVDYLASDKPSKTKLLEIQTGFGKGISSMSGVSRIGKRLLIIVKPMYIEKWVKELCEVFEMDKKEIAAIQGSGQLMNLITNAKQGKMPYRVVIISNRTIQNWLSLYEKKGEYTDSMGYDCRPHELCHVLNVGIRLIDEVHQDFHLNFKLDLYTHVDRVISLSATLKGDDSFLNRMYEVAYPQALRYAGAVYDKYIHAYAWMYRVKDPDKIRTTEWASTIYSHHAFEKSIMRDRYLLTGYLRMITACSKRFFMESYKSGHKLLIYCASVQMCTLLVEYLKIQFKHLEIRRYVEDDPFDNLQQADVVVTTLLSAGTGFDIKNLTTVILTTAISSSQSNIQGFGRLRKMADTRLQFVYFVCLDVPKHMEYHDKKKDILHTRALSIDYENYPESIGT